MKTDVYYILGVPVNVWVGGRSHSDDYNFVWESGVPVDQPNKHPMWEGANPNWGGSTFTCIYMYYGWYFFQFYDYPCINTLPSFLCELPL